MSDGLAVIEHCWPAPGSVAYAELQKTVRQALEQIGVTVRNFSHVGIVVRDMNGTLAQLAAADARWKDVSSVWGEAFDCHIAKNDVEGMEIEIIEPVGESFLKQRLDRDGETVDHVSFYVEDIAGALASVRAAGGAMTHPEVCEGLHGRIAFVDLPTVRGVHVELCENRNHRGA